MFKQLIAATYFDRYLSVFWQYCYLLASASPVCGGLSPSIIEVPCCIVLSVFIRLQGSFTHVLFVLLAHTLYMIKKTRYSILRFFTLLLFLRFCY